MPKIITSKVKKHRGIELIPIIVWVSMVAFPIFSMGQEINGEGWPVPDLKGLIPYSITVKRIDGVEKVVERFYTSDGGHVARVSGNGKVFAYAVDFDKESPIDYLLLDPNGYGKFIHRFRAEESYLIPEWVSN